MFATGVTAHALTVELPDVVPELPEVAAVPDELADPVVQPPTANAATSATQVTDSNQRRNQKATAVVAASLKKFAGIGASAACRTATSAAAATAAPSSHFAPRSPPIRVQLVHHEVENPTPVGLKPVAGFREDAGCAAAPSLSGVENVPPTNARRVAQPPMASG